ncbi:hypothetical protein HDU79_003997 [Rhizoclosmatium sp. JEL0117]|nr:hypothetical protein HDU79_003997 [Rhizoclosmatium sp. JEL0117]
MQFAVFSTGYSDQHVGYKFTDRKGKVDGLLSSLSPPERDATITALKSLLNSYVALEFEEGDVNYIREELNKIVSDDQRSLLSSYCDRLVQRRSVDITVKWDDHLIVEYTGTWFDTILLEVPFMAIIVEFCNTLAVREDPSDERVLSTLQSKLDVYGAAKATVVEFGTRRRFNQRTHFLIINALHESPISPPVYTSNVLQSKRNYTPPRGTCAHEWFMFFESLQRVSDPLVLTLDSLVASIATSLKFWLSVYQSVFALTDVFTTRVFFMAYKTLDSSLQSRIHYRCDSGEELRYTQEIASILGDLGLSVVEHLESKMIMFSNSLNPSKVAVIQDSWVNDKEKGLPTAKGFLYGVGTNFSNDLQYDTMDIVIKLNTLEGGNRLK